MTNPSRPQVSTAITSANPAVIHDDAGKNHDEFAKSKIAATNAELVEERETVKEMLG